MQLQEPGARRCMLGASSDFKKLRRRSTARSTPRSAPPGAATRGCRRVQIPQATASVTASRFSSAHSEQFKVCNLSGSRGKERKKPLRLMSSVARRERFKTVAHSKKTTRAPARRSKRTKRLGASPSAAHPAIQGGSSRTVPAVAHRQSLELRQTAQVGNRAHHARGDPRPAPSLSCVGDVHKYILSLGGDAENAFCPARKEARGSRRARRARGQRDEPRVREVDPRDAPEHGEETRAEREVTQIHTRGARRLILAQLRATGRGDVVD